MSSSKMIFHENFINFFQNPKISQKTDFEEGKHEWISFLNITESTMHPCVCGHNVKHITYLLNECNQNIVSIGTTCCKKYGLLGKHMKNELFIHVLKEQISQHSFKNSGNLLSLEKDLEELLENYIYEKFQEIMKKYSRDMDENIYYFDVFYPLNRMREDILELKEYGYDFSKHHDEICELLRERDIYIKESLEKTDSDSETNSEIMEKLDSIQYEISQLLNENLEENVLEENVLEENVLEENVLEENVLEENLRIEEEIKKEIEEKEAEEYVENENRQLEETVSLYTEPDLNILSFKTPASRAVMSEESISVCASLMRNGEKNDDYRIKYTEKDLKFMIEMHSFKIRIENLQKGIREYKKDVDFFDKNLQKLKMDVKLTNEKIINLHR